MACASAAARAASSGSTSMAYGDGCDSASAMACASAAATAASSGSMPVVLSPNGNGAASAASVNANSESISMVLSLNGNDWATVDSVRSVVAFTIIRGSITGIDALVKKPCASTAILGCV